MPGPTVLPRRVPCVPHVARRLLLGAVLIGLLALQLLSGHDASGGHRMLAPAEGAMTAGGMSHGIAPVTASDRDAAADAMIAAGRPGGDGFGIVAGCALLLVGVAIALAAVVVRSRARLHRPAPVTGGRGRLRGPPELLPRIALCVERI